MQLQPERKGRNYNPSANRWAPLGRYKAIGYKPERNRQIRPRKLAKPDAGYRTVFFHERVLTPLRSTDEEPWVLSNSTKGVAFSSESACCTGT